MGIMERLDAGGITLERWTGDRADALNRAINDSMPELIPFMAWATADHDLAATTAYLTASHKEWDTGENFNFAMITPQGEVVGSCGLMSRQGVGVLEVGYWVHSAHAGRGYATAAASCLAEVGLGQAGIDLIEIHHDVDNPASGRVAANAGFQQMGPVEAEKKAPSDSGTHLVWARGAGSASSPS